MRGLYKHRIVESRQGNVRRTTGKISIGQPLRLPSNLSGPSPAGASLHLMTTLPQRPTGGFTLFEVSISLVLVTFGVVSVLMLLPHGLRAQQHARYQIHAAVQAQNIASLFANPSYKHYNVQVESEKLTNNSFMNRQTASLENLIADNSLGLAPMPEDIARRIDSDNNEIENIIGQGGRLYYNLPGGAPQRLVMGIVGYQQQNALPNHPCLAWPYWENHPCPPSPWQKKNWELNAAATQAGHHQWPGLAEFNALYSVMNSATTPNQAFVTVAKWTDYKRAAQALVAAVAAETDSGLTTETLYGGLVLHPPKPYPPKYLSDPLQRWDVPAGAAGNQLRRNMFPKPYVVWAASHLAHAAAFGTGTVSGRTGGPTLEERNYARVTYEACRQWVMRYGAADPNNWGAGRHTAQMTAWDTPILQYDLFPDATFPVYSDTSSDPIVVPPDPPRFDTSWRVVASSPILDYGQARGAYGAKPPGSSLTFLPPNKSNIDQSFGNPLNYHLARRFDATERMRQIVFWTVDWQTYEDFEEQPAAKHDSTQSFMDSYGVQVSSDWWGITLPERSLYWTTVSRNQRAGDVRGANGGNQTWDQPWTLSPAYKQGFFMGYWGADRNGNNRFDRGVVPKSVRLRASQIARFTLYDRVLIGDLRH
jgi:hypothetical protein